MTDNAHALSRLLITERSMLVRVIRRIVGSSSDAEDVVQSLWVKVQTVKEQPPISNKPAYLFRLATNLASSHRTRDQQRNAAQAAASELLGSAYDFCSPERVSIGREEMARIERVIGDLPTQTRRIFLLNRFHGLSQACIAEKLCLSSTAVERHMRRALERIAYARDNAD